MPTMKQDHYLTLCMTQAALSPQQYRHGAVLVKGGKVLGAGRAGARGAGRGLRPRLCTPTGTTTTITRGARARASSSRTAARLAVEGYVRAVLAAEGQGDQRGRRDGLRT